MKLIIAEKNSVAADIAKAMGLAKVGTHYANDEYLCIGAVGHLCRLLPAGEVGKWGELDSLPLLVDEWQSVVIEDTSDKYKAIRELAQRRDVVSLINACDAGREGELIFKLIVQAMKVSKPVKRAWLQSMTQEGIKEAFANLRADDANLEAGARCRSIADFLVGINGTRGMSLLKRHATGERDIVQVGRVRTPVLGLVYDREHAIATFKAKPFWRSVAKFIANKSGQGFEAELVEEAPWAGQTKEIADGLANSCAQPADAAVVAAEDVLTPTKRNPPSLYDLTALQRKMNRQYGMSAAATLDVVQSLYEKHKVLSYPRTDSKKLPEDYHAKAQEAFGFLAASELVPEGLRKVYARLSGEGAQAVQRPGKRVFDNGGVTDHFAIIPLGGTSSAGALSDAERKVFEAVCLVFAQAFHTPALIDKTVRTIELANKAKFQVQGRVVTDPGWFAVAGEVEDEEGGKDSKDAALPPMDGPASIRYDSLRTIESKTKAPPFFTEDTLLGAMENAGRYVEDGELSQALADRGLGTPATRGATIQSLLASETTNGAAKLPDMGVQDGKWLRITRKGAASIKELRAYGAELLCSPDMTGEWELKLRAIERGELGEAEFLSQIKRFCDDLVKPLKDKAASTPKFVEQPLKGACPACGAATIRPQRYSFACDCGEFKLSREIAKRAVTAEEAEELLKDGETSVLKGFVSKDGKKFDAMLKVAFSDEKQAHEVQFAFPEREPPKHFCKACGKGLVFRTGVTKRKRWKFWGCLGYKDGCTQRYDDLKGSPKF